MTTLGGRLYAGLPTSVRRLVPVDLRSDLRARFAAWEPGDLGFEPAPPPVAPGEHPGPPDFLVLGPPESGARWWLSLIEDHPDVAPTRDPEGAAHALDRYCTEAFDDEQVARFHRRFPRRPGRIIGHWSSDGLSYPWIAPLLAVAAPRAKVLVLVRDPVDLVADRVVATAARRAPHPGSSLADAVDRGFVGAQVARLRELFPADAVRVLQYARCRADSTDALAATYRFLGVPVPDGPALPHPADGTTPAPAERLDAATRARLWAMYVDDTALLSELVPDLDLGRWPSSGSGA